VEALRREGDKWLIVGVWKDEARARIEPFGAIELEVGVLWADVKTTR
jgi:hypothetical protein